MARAYPGDAGLTRHLDRRAGGMGDDQMADAIVAIDDRRGPGAK